MTARARGLRFVLPALVLAWAPAALADILPAPERPVWNEHPAPMPEPPPDEDAERRALVALAAALGAGGWLLSRHRRAGHGRLLEARGAARAAAPGERA